MQNRYTGDIGDFGKFLLLKHLFPAKAITTVWYLYPDETHNNDGSHTVEENNIPLYSHCYAIDSAMSELFHQIHRNPKRDVRRFEEVKILENGSYFGEGILGEGDRYRIQWLERAIHFVREKQASVVCLDPDNGIKTGSMRRLSRSKQGKYATLNEIENFFLIDSVQHLIIYQHFNRLKKHTEQMEEKKAYFDKEYEGRAMVTILRHNPVQARFYIILSKKGLDENLLHSLEQIRYADKPFFTLLGN
ncbi:MAG: hypothetical protein AB7S65_06750 [Sulfuricurvum sp.]